MLKTNKRIWVSRLSSMVVVLTIAGIWLFGGIGTASAAENLEAITQASAMPGLLGEGYLNHGGGWGDRAFKNSSIDYAQLLADDLGIAVEDLETAHQAARDAAIEQAIVEGLITQEQADAMKESDGFGGRGFNTFGFGRAPRGFAGHSIDQNALLADALGITVEELQIARDVANQSAIDQAIETGVVTQELVDKMQTRKDLMQYLDRNALLANALGMTTEALQAAFDEGKALSDLISDKNFDAAAMHEALQAAFTEALTQAVADGVITQEQADEMLESDRGWGMMRRDRVPLEGFEMPEGFEGSPGRGGFRGRRHGIQRRDDTSESDSRFQRSAFRGGNDA